MADADAIAFADSTQENNRKLFVGGLSWETTSDNLRAYMSRYGEVVDCSVKMDIATGRSRGFGFVMFRTADEAETVLKSRPHMLDGKIIDPKKAVGITKSGMPITKKIFVGGVRSETSDDLLRDYFSQFGTVHSIDFPIDHTSNKRRGFCFLEFDEPEAAEKAMAMNFHPVANQTVEVKPAYTKEQQQALMARGLWPPPSGRTPHNSSTADGVSQMEMGGQNSLKNMMCAQGQSPSQDPSSGAFAAQYNQLAAAAIFYQTYLQCAMAMSAASIAPSSNASQSSLPSQQQQQLPPVLTGSGERSPVPKRDSPRHKDRDGRRSSHRSSASDRHHKRRRSENGHRDECHPYKR